MNQREDSDQQHEVLRGGTAARQLERARESVAYSGNGLNSDSELRGGLREEIDTQGTNQMMASRTKAGNGVRETDRAVEKESRKANPGNSDHNNRNLARVQLLR